MDPVTDSRIATPDPPPTGIPNPIHDAEGADAAGYAGALVAGVRTYGWAAQTIVRALGEEWLGSGWVDFSLRRPLFSGEVLTTTLTPDDGGAWRIECIGRGQGGERVVLDGSAGVGEAPWLGDLDPPEPAPGLDPPPVRPTYDLDTVPRGEPLRPLRVYLKADAARSLAADDLGLDDDRYRTGAAVGRTVDAGEVPGTRVPVHPYFLAGRMAPLTRHNFTYGPTIHVRSQIQHRTEGRSDQEITVGARIVDAYDRNEHWYQVLDGIVTGSVDGELALIRHHTIFRPRGTTMPPPITSDTIP
jgi:hypothetical protein